MNRRRFLQNTAVAAAAIEYFSRAKGPLAATELQSVPDTQGHTLICEFKRGATTWKVYEDLRTREGVLTFVSSSGDTRVLSKSAEATFAEVDPPHLGLSMNDIGLAGADLLADRLFAGAGDPDPEMVKAAALGSFTPPPPTGAASPGGPGGGNPRTRWTTFVGTVEAL